MKEGEKNEFRVKLPIIELPDNYALRKALEIKLLKYNMRILLNPANLDAFYKKLIVQCLLANHQVTTSDIYFQVRQAGEVDSFVFNNAVAVIEDYVTTGGKNTVFIKPKHLAIN